jgi:acetyltransferase-like isoleucine patch superfamily enzyme
MNLLQWVNRLTQMCVRIYSRLIARSFRAYRPSRVHYSARIYNPHRISLLGVTVGRGVWLYAITGDSAGNTYSPDLVIGNGTQIGDYCHITCATRLEVGENVLMGQGVLIADSNHRFDDVGRPVMSQGLVARPISVGEGSWLGNHAVVVGCSIGRNCVVGANAVVTRDVPDCCVVAGAPARIIKRYDEAARAWVRPG